MKEKYGDDVELSIHPTHSEAAKGYNFKKSTNVLVNDELLSYDIALDREKLEQYISEYFA